MKWEGQNDSGKWNENLTFFSPDGQVFESTKVVVDFLRSTPGYTDQEAENVLEFQRRRSQAKKRRQESGSSSSPLEPPVKKGRQEELRSSKRTIDEGSGASSKRLRGGGRES